MKRDKLRRIVALCMVIFLLISILGSVFFYLITPLYAAASLHPYDASKIDDKLIRVGLWYGDNVIPGFETKAEYGFTINKVNRSTDNTHEPLYVIDDTKVSCIIDANLSKSGMTYNKTSKESSVVVGGFHAELDMDLTGEELVLFMNSFDEIYEELGVYPIPSYINGSFRIRAGHFSNIIDAELLANELEKMLSGIDVKAVAPSLTAVTVINPETDKLLFMYDDGDKTAIGLTANYSPEGNPVYMFTPKGNSYEGVFMFRRYISDAADGISLTNVIKLGEYLEGVLPYEIQSTWNYESIKAFSIVARSWVLSSGLNKHNRLYQFDVCNSQDCQVYGGRGRESDNIMKIVEETAGVVMSYNGKIAKTYYSSSTGGSTISCYEAWGYQHFDYLVGLKTPWENYTNSKNGEWTKEFTPVELLNRLRDQGYTSLKGAIESINIDKFATNSDHVYQLTVTDIHGTKVTLKTGVEVYTTLGLYSSNFVVGKGSVTAPKVDFYKIDLNDVKVTSKDSVIPFGDSEVIYTITANGIEESTPKSSFVLTGNGKVQIGETSSQSSEVDVSASSPNNFIFVGRGWGHGVGLSHAGLRDLGKLGYGAQEILLKYFPGVSFTDWHTLIN